MKTNFCSTCTSCINGSAKYLTQKEYAKEKPQLQHPDQPMARLERTLEHRHTKRKNTIRKATRPRGYQT